MCSPCTPLLHCLCHLVPCSLVEWQELRSTVQCIHVCIMQAACSWCLLSWCNSTASWQPRWLDDCFGGIFMAVVKRAWLLRARLGWACPCCLCASSQRSKSVDATDERPKLMLNVSAMLPYVFPGHLRPKKQRNMNRRKNDTKITHCGIYTANSVSGAFAVG
jgi:hypothetical protein